MNGKREEGLRREKSCMEEEEEEEEVVRDMRIEEKRLKGQKKRRRGRKDKGKVKEKKNATPLESLQASPAHYSALQCSNAHRYS